MKVRTLRRLYLREAAIMLVLASLAVRFFSPARVFAWANHPPRRVRRFVADEPAWISWAVASLAGRPWMNVLCLPRALAAHAMLRRRGIASRLCLGVARDNGDLTAHAWVVVGDHKLVGGAEAEKFTRLAEFGGAH
jgi:Transglutaminase-like superfamily